MKPLKILVADDSASIGLFIRELLTSSGHTVTVVRSGEEALDSYRQDPPELVLMDLNMPGIGGKEAIRQIRALHSSSWVPIIIITGSHDEADVLDGFMVGADDYLVKPINPLILEVRMRTMMRIASIQRTAEAVIENVLEGIIRIDRVGRITAFNKAAETIFGYTAEEVLWQNVKMLMPSPYREAHDEYIGNYVATGERKVIGIGRKVTGMRKSGETFPMHLGVTEAATPDDQFFVGLIRDLTLEEALRGQIEHQATHDLLTDLPNRAMCRQHLAARFVPDRSGKRSAACTLLYCDLDGFKQVNDQYGHTQGDEVLKIVAERMRSNLFVRDFLARIGGDEFIAIIDGSLSDQDALLVADRLISGFKTPIPSQKAEHTLGISIGIAHSRHFDTQEAMVNAADEAMYAAKRRSGNAAVLAS